MVYNGATRSCYVLLLLVLTQITEAMVLKRFEISAFEISEDSCACLNWKKMYTSGRVVCGEFLEVGSQTNGNRNMTFGTILNLWQTNPSMMQEFCPDYIQRLDSTMCLNANDHNLSAGSWCYVSDKCKKLNGGQHISGKFDTRGRLVKRDVSAKFCQRGVDRRLRDMTPPQLQKFALKNHVKSLGLVALTAYSKIMPNVALWGQVEPLWKSGKTKGMPAALKASIASKKPIMMYTGGDYHSHYVIVWGHKLIHLDKNGTCPAQYCYTAGPSFGSR